MPFDISGPREPMDKGSEFDGITTPMCDANVGKKNMPGAKNYSNTFNADESRGTSNSIEGPGVKGQYPIKAPKTTELKP